MYDSSNNGRWNIINNSKATSYTKHKLIRLKGKKLKELNDKIYERDGGFCIICEAIIPEGTKFHHVNQGANKEDIEENGVMLCQYCHHDAHFSDRVKKIRGKCIDYLVSIYNNREYFK